MDSIVGGQDWTSIVMLDDGIGTGPSWNLLDDGDGDGDGDGGTADVVLFGWDKDNKILVRNPSSSSS